MFELGNEEIMFRRGKEKVLGPDKMGRKIGYLLLIMTSTTDSYVQTAVLALLSPKIVL